VPGDRWLEDIVADVRVSKKKRIPKSMHFIHAVNEARERIAKLPNQIAGKTHP